MQRIVTLGGGTGHFQLLKGLKQYESDLTAIVSISDDGGSSGKLRDEYGILPPGDLRQCMVALAPDENHVLRNLFAYRFNDGHNLGNLIITAAGHLYGGEMQGIQVASKLLNVQGTVLPVSTGHCTLVAETQTGEIIRGESKIDVIPGKETRIRKIWLEPQPFIFSDAAKKIKNAYKIVIAPGDLYGSAIPHFLVDGMKEALQQSKAEKIYVCNLFTKNGCYGFKASDFVKEIENYAGVKMDHILINTFRPPPETLGYYFSENAEFVEDDLGDDARVIRRELAQVYPSTPNPILRHNPEKVARAIMEIPYWKK